MKTKHINKKLSVKKSTIANLYKEELSEALGGATTTCGGHTYVPQDSVCLICTGQCPVPTDAC